MTKKKPMFLGVCALLAFGSAGVQAAKDPIAQQEPAYNTATVIDVFAVVSSVREVPVGNPLAGLHVDARSNGKNFDVFVGPASFVKKLGLTLANGNEIHVIGSKVTLDDADVILVREITKGKTLNRWNRFVEEATFVMRDDDGPVWLWGKAVE